ncbi:hypothetical protein QCA50_019838 [Cerrena zonata]|uniref:Helicase C-terminal domain-containing protein n=1 Tax=Cerrena zonata TaxID=2478898 RepID=A0AAW0FGJ3_9APHY
MPTFSYGSSLLNITAEFRQRTVSVNTPVDPNAPWSWPTWQKRTGFAEPPWEAVPPTQKHPFGWTERECSLVKCYVDSFCKIRTRSERLEFSRAKGDNTAEGRKLYNQAINLSFNGKWKLVDAMHRCFRDSKKTFESILADHGSRNLPEIFEEDLGEVKDLIADSIFGESGKKPGSSKSTPEVRKAIDYWVSNLWHAMTSKYRRDGVNMDKLAIEVAETLHKFETTDRNMATLRLFLQKSGRLMQYYRQFGDIESQAQIHEYRDKLTDIRLALSIDMQGKTIHKISPALRQSLMLLSKQEDVDRMDAEIAEEIINLSKDSVDIPVLTLDSIDLKDWESGVEKYQTMNSEAICALLGISPDGTLPHFNNYIDAVGIRDPWIDDSLHNEALDDPDRKLLRPHWHQLVGMLKMLDSAFAGGPILLMDGVGLGKTLQVIGVIALLAYYRKTKQDTGQFPGIFKGKKFQEHDNIPDEACLLVVPLSLRAQVEVELHRYLKRGSFDVLLYDRGALKMPDYWHTTFHMSKHAPGHRIVLATMTALTSDAINCLQYASTSPNNAPKVIENCSPTLLTRKWLFTAVDEVHNARNVGQSYWAVWGLRQCSRGFVGMSATPVLTRPHDLYHIGRFMEIKGFDNALDYQTMIRDMTKASRLDRNERDERGVWNVDFFRGQEEANIPDHVAQYSMHWMNKMRAMFEGHIIRRDSNSVTYNGKSIIDIKPYKYVALELALTPTEQDGLDEITTAFEKKSSNKRTEGQHFYLAFRRRCLHPDLHTGRETTLAFNTLGDWEANPSTKLAALVRVLTYHLKSDARSPMTTVDGELVDGPDEPLTTEDNLPCDKIVVYSAFVINTRYIKQVLNVHEIQYLSIDGGMTVARRTKVIHQFRTSGVDGPRVLLVSIVGTTGLNLPFANILVSLDVNWSEQDENQLRGRLWRQNQPKTVVFYQLVARGTSDVFLNNIAFGKGVMLKAFVSAPKGLQKWFHPDYIEDNLQKDDFDYALAKDNDKDEDEDETPKTKGKRKAKAKKAAQICEDQDNTQASKSKKKTKAKASPTSTETAESSTNVSTEAQTATADPSQSKNKGKRTTPAPRKKITKKALAAAATADTVTALSPAAPVTADPLLVPTIPTPLHGSTLDTPSLLPATISPTSPSATIAIVAAAGLAAPTSAEGPTTTPSAPSPALNPPHSEFTTTPAAPLAVLSQYPAIQRPLEEQTTVTPPRPRGTNTALVNTSPTLPAGPSFTSPAILIEQSLDSLSGLQARIPRMEDATTTSRPSHLPDDPIADNVAMSLDDHRDPTPPIFDDEYRFDSPTPNHSPIRSGSPSTIGVHTPTGPKRKAPSDTLSSDEMNAVVLDRGDKRRDALTAILSQEKAKGPTMLKLAPDSHRKRLGRKR